MSEKTFKSQGRHFKNYALPENSIVLSLIAVFTALSFVVTYLSYTFPITATGGYFNFGDIIVMYVALLFGPIIGAFVGGFGPMLADIFLGVPIFAPGTLVIKFIEGFLIGIIADPKEMKHLRIGSRDIIAVIIGGLTIPIGYFIYEIFIFGIAGAISEFPINVLQFIVAAIISTFLIILSRKNILEGLPQIFDKVFVNLD